LENPEIIKGGEGCSVFHPEGGCPIKAERTT
jgi:hypothetical protein